CFSGSNPSQYSAQSGYVTRHDDLTGARHQKTWPNALGWPPNAIIGCVPGPAARLAFVPAMSCCSSIAEEGSMPIGFTPPPAPPENGAIGCCGCIIGG